MFAEAIVSNFQKDDKDCIFLHWCFSYPRLFLRCSCHERPNGRTGQDHQYQGFNHGALGNVITLFGPHGMLHRSFKSTMRKQENMYIHDHSKVTKCVEEREHWGTYSSRKHPSDSPREGDRSHPASSHLQADGTSDGPANPGSSWQESLDLHRRDSHVQFLTHGACYWRHQLKAARPNGTKYINRWEFQFGI